MNIYQDNQQPSFDFKPLKEDSDYLIYSDGRLYSKKSKRFLVGKLDNSGYKMYALACSNNYSKINQRKLSKMMYAHRLVGEYFVENPNHYNIVHHKDNNKLNNNFKNLEWVDNLLHASYHNNVLQTKKPRSKAKFYTDDLNGEIWKVFPLNIKYLISNYGRVRNIQTNRLLHLDNSQKYVRVSLNDKKHYYIHRMVYCTFYNDFDLQDMVIDHIDNDPTNNHLDNLQKITQSENCLKQKRFNDYRKDNESE